MSADGKGVGEATASLAGEPQARPSPVHRQLVRLYELETTHEAAIASRGRQLAALAVFAGLVTVLVLVVTRSEERRAEAGALLARVWPFLVMAVNGVVIPFLVRDFVDRRKMGENVRTLRARYENLDDPPDPEEVELLDAALKRLWGRTLTW